MPICNILKKTNIDKVSQIRAEKLEARRSIWMQKKEKMSTAKV
jgi:hypothetical protein